MTAANIAVVESRRIESGVTFTGELVPAEIVEVNARFDGDLEAVQVREGQRVADRHGGRRRLGAVVDGRLVINPPFTDLHKSDIDIMVAATLENIVMVEGEMSEVSEEDMLEALKFGHEAIKVQCRAQLELMEEAGKIRKREYSHEVHDEELRKRVWEAGYDKFYQIAKTIPGKHERHDALEGVRTNFIASFPEGTEVNETLINRYFHDVEKEAVRNLILQDGQQHAEFPGSMKGSVRQPCKHCGNDLSILWDHPGFWRDRVLLDGGDQSHPQSQDVPREEGARIGVPVPVQGCP